ncbi:potassium channel family protein [Chondromyces apiculatus]|uniref:Trk system potassium uptake protein TrkA n=1 Tax=Chondromyces apiculatus DSM 436 TaxID=1192034 RepID=A0A017SXC6_9BACT|nr:TrkA family potassium uptake protein [Chondromyces apiculatus]EYF01275.1 Trk system potassium uptake protein TrkA [Chondromyces apiculatus DSM 436]
MRIVIVGAGRAGLSVAIHLRAGGHDVTVVDRDTALTARAFEQHGLVALVGDATDALLLKEAEVARADVVAAMLRRDADNLAVALLSQAAGARRVMVRMRDPEYRSVYERAKVDRIFSEMDVFIGAIGTAIEHTAVRNALLLGKGLSVAFELEVPSESAVVGRPVSAIAADPGFPGSCVFAAMHLPDGTIEAPRGSSVVQAGMLVLLVASRHELGTVIEFFLRKA